MNKEEYKQLNGIYAITLTTDNGQLILIENGSFIAQTVITRYSETMTTEEIWNDAINTGIVLGVEIRIDENAQAKLKKKYYHMNNKETPKQAGLRYVGMLESKMHIFIDCANNHYEVWGCNKYHGSYGLIWRNTHLEFCRSATDSEVTRVHNHSKQ